MFSFFRPSLKSLYTKQDSNREKLKAAFAVQFPIGSHVQFGDISGTIKGHDVNLRRVIVKKDGSEGTLWIEYDSKELTL